ncbi:MAG: hypothetical protein AAF799_42080 [Myxococcota bacterium]
MYSSRWWRRALSPLLLTVALSPACDEDDAPPKGTANEAAAGAGVVADETPADAPPPAPALPEAEVILDKATAALGGREAIDRIQSFHYRGTIEMVGHNIHGKLQIWWKKGDFFMEQIVPGIGEMRAGKRGDEIWADDPVNGRRKLTGVEAEQHAWASTLLLAAAWKDYFDEAETVAERKVKGRTLYDVKLTSKSGMAVTMSFDADSGLQVGQAFEQVTPMGKQPFDVTFQDYREVEGIKFAFKQVIDAKFQEIVQEIEHVELNAEVDPSKFAFPRSGADLVRQKAEAKAGG